MTNHQKPSGVAVLGTGRMGRRHIQAVRLLGLPVVGVADINAESLELGRAECAGPVETSADPAELVRRLRPECVVVSTTAPSHADLVCAAAENGARYIFCEKPMATSIRDAKRMVAACDASGAKLGVNHQMAFMPHHRAALDICASDAFGGFTSMNVVAGNFGLAMNGSHYFELFRNAAGEGADNVTAWFSEGEVPNPRGPQFRDVAGSIFIRTAGGKRFFMECGSDQGYGMHAIYSGRFGALYVDELAGTARFALRTAADRALPTTRYGMPPEVTNHDFVSENVESTAALLKAMITGGADYPGGREGLLTVRTLAAAYLSNENGHVAVSVNGDLPEDRVFAWA